MDALVSSEQYSQRYCRLHMEHSGNILVDYMVGKEIYKFRKCEKELIKEQLKTLNPGLCENNRHLVTKMVEALIEPPFTA